MVCLFVKNLGRNFKGHPNKDKISRLFKFKNTKRGLR